MDRGVTVPPILTADDPQPVLQDRGPVGGGIGGAPASCSDREAAAARAPECSRGKPAESRDEGECDAGAASDHPGSPEIGNARLRRSVVHELEGRGAVVDDEDSGHKAMAAQPHAVVMSVVRGGMVQDSQTADGGGDEKSGAGLAAVEYDPTGKRQEGIARGGSEQALAMVAMLAAVSGLHY